MPQSPEGKLLNRSSGEELNDIRDYKKIYINADTCEDILNISNGVFSPLKGFLGYNDLENVLFEKRLINDTPWTIPILLDLNKDNFKEGDTILLINDEIGLKSQLDIEEIYTYDKKKIAEKIFGTIEIDHPGVANLMKSKEHFISGKLKLLENKTRDFDEYNLNPKETRFLFREKGWKEIVAFQTRNPPHIGHEYVQKTALTFVDGIFINPIIGKKKTGDFTDKVIIESYKSLIDHYYLKNRAVMSILRTTMKYAGPREAIHHAIMRKNFGCTHFIVGRDHAGVGNYYKPYDAHDIFAEFPDLGITPVFFRSFSRCSKCESVVNDKICPHDQKYHINFSGKKIREILKKGGIPPEDMMRKEVAKTILKFNKPFID